MKPVRLQLSRQKGFDGVRMTIPAKERMRLTEAQRRALHAALSVGILVQQADHLWRWHAIQPDGTSYLAAINPTICVLLDAGCLRRVSAHAVKLTEAGLRALSDYGTD